MNAKSRNLVGALVLIAVVASFAVFQSFQANTGSADTVGSALPTVTITSSTTKSSTVELPTPHYYYDVEFMCNSVNATDATLVGLAPGFYYTDIDIHNPSSAAYSVTIEKQFTVETTGPTSTGAGGSYPGPTVTQSPSPSTVQYETLSPSAAVLIDCSEILSLLSPPSPSPSLTVAKGFVKILAFNTGDNANPTLDVWAEYTTQSCAAGTPNCSQNTPSLVVVPASQIPAVAYRP